jgi:Tfp pilus assembly protein PilV
VHKYDYYIQDYLLNEGTFSAEHIGEFNIIRQEGNTAPLVNFTYNKHAGTSQELVAYVAGREHKSKVVIGFDLEAHFDEARQFMNTGKPWVIPGIGQLQMNMNREYELVPQQEEQAAAMERKRVIQSSQPSNEYGLQRSEGVNNNRAGVILLSLLVIAALGFAGYYLYSNQQQAQASTTSADTVATQTDTMVSVPSPSNMNSTTTKTAPPNTSTAQQPAANTTTTNTNGAMSVRYVIARTTNTAYAYKRFSQLKSYGIAVSMDSVRRDTSTAYKIYLTKSLTPADTARVKDSLSVYFGKPVRIESVK